MLAPIAHANDWEFKLAPMYLWGQSVEGTSFIGPSGADLDLDFTDEILENINTALTVHFEAVNDDLTFFVDLNHVSLDPESQVADRVNASIDYEMNMAEVGTTWAFADNGNTRWEAMLGLRYIEQDVDVELRAELPPPFQRLRKVGGGDEWYHPFLGARVFQKLSESWAFIGRADYGYSDSDNTAFNTQLTFDWRFNSWGSVLLGYRYMEYDYEGGSGINRYAADMEHQGPVIGLNIRW
ncbi:MAG: hypothetical protein AAGI11_16600 [Pseudomonadota bacterium]